MTRFRVGLALGGGAARGWSHIGVLETLVGAGIEPTVIAGTSIGALVGAAHACGRLGELKAWAQAVDWRTIASLLDVKVANGGLIDGARVQRLLRDLGIDTPIEDLPVKYAAVATDLADGREIWLETGPVDAAIRASIGLPGIFSPTLADGKWLVDGGLVNQVPVSTARALGADFIIAVGLSDGMLAKRAAGLSPAAAEEASAAQRGRLMEMVAQMPGPFREQAVRILPQLLASGPKSPGYFDVLANALNIMQDRITRSRLAGEPPHAMISPQVAHIRLMDFHRAGEAIEAGRIAAEKALDGLKAQLGG
ncbi:patatin-like phospholipase family protein [Mesorhizobium sp. J428]|uniref:patatin-like phospholipase family protein n=1 Tax=Mesorhizobium sp. J428 TaxID=2898440 RepID=UPI0021517A4A|nr:patatin-like phospholipase family protein [Mesorhizobium sp. J428]MCR5856659.1 patatin-like phospholipase family protein [Mesorhizobium sp. J428]